MGESVGWDGGFGGVWGMGGRWLVGDCGLGIVVVIFVAVTAR